MNTIVCYLLLAGLIYISNQAFLQKRTTLQFPPCCFLLSRFDDSVYWCDSEFLSCMTPAKLSDNTFFLSNSDSLLKYLNVDLIDQDRSIKSFPYGSSLPKFSSNVKRIGLSLLTSAPPEIVRKP